MKFNLLLYLLLFICVNSYASNKNQLLRDTTRQHQIKRVKKSPYPPLPRSPEEAERLYKPWYSDCAFTNEYSINKRLKKYPFSRAGKILAISYHLFDWSASVKNDSLKALNILPKDKLLQGGFSIKNDTLDHSTLIECIALTNDQIRRLAVILYNIGFKKTGYNIVGGASCYEPRNALIFVDKQGKAYDYLAICFACQHYGSKLDRLNVGIDCTQKYEILRKFFKDIGIEFGTRKNEDRK